MGTSAIESKLLQQLTSVRYAVLFEVFLYLQKAYDSLDWDRCIDIIVEYGVSPKAIRILRAYWCQITMVVRASRYYGLPFKGYRGVNQVYPLSPTLFNVVVDTVIHHWVAVVVATKEGMEVLGMSIRYL